VAALDEQVDRSTGRRPVGERLMELETLDRRILSYLQGGTPVRRAPEVPPVPDDEGPGGGRRRLRLIGR
jgi:hypothetical protein